MATQEILRVKNFAGIQDAEIELSRMNVFIGPQASGKSVCAKLVYFFREMVRRVAFDLGEQKYADLQQSYEDKFSQYFPSANWNKQRFEIEYINGELWIKARRTEARSASILISYSPYYDNLLLKAIQDLENLQSKQKSEDFTFPPEAQVQSRINRILASDIAPSLSNMNYFIPAGRSFFTAFGNNIFNIAANEIDVDPFLAKFGQLYVSARRFYTSKTEGAKENKEPNDFTERISALICGAYKRVNARDYIVTSDGRQVALENSSSGQQEVLPLTIILARINESNARKAQTTLFVEEPEAHLYPTAQREIVHLLSSVTDLSSNDSSSQYVITTHSPYILSALNNLMYGEQIARQSSSHRVRVGSILGDTVLIDPTNVRAYAFGDGRVRSIISEETGLVEAAVLDSVSNELADEFEALVDIAYEEQAA